MKNKNSCILGFVGLILIMIFIAGCQYYPNMNFKTDENQTVQETKEQESVTDLNTEEVIETNTDEQSETEPKEIEQEITPVPKTDNEITEETTNKTATTSGIPKKEVIEGEFVNFPNLQKLTQDTDGDPIIVTYSKPLNEKGEWQTQSGDAGEYMITFKLSDGTNEKEQRLILIVKQKNNAPVLQKISDITITEGDTINLNPEVSDAENDPVKIIYSGWMTSNIKKTGTGDEGEHKVTVTASDGITESKTEFKITVIKQNRNPLIEDMKEIIITEKELAKVNVIAADPDGDKITIKYSFPFNSAGEWQTKEGDAGIYSSTISVSDGKATSTKTVKITVNPINNPPTLTNVKEQITIKEGETIEFNPVSSDPEGKSVTIKYSGWMTTNKYTSNYNDAGEHEVTITASDGTKETSMKVKITVLDVNRAPVFPDNWWE